MTWLRRVKNTIKAKREQALAPTKRGDPPQAECDKREYLKCEKHFALEEKEGAKSKLLRRSSLIVGGVLLLLGLARLLAAALLPRPLQSQRQAERWAGESGKRFKQFTCILSPGQTLTEETVYAFRGTVSEKVSASEFETPAGGSAYCDAWSVGGTVKVGGPRGNFDAGALAVGGRFFDFHPMRLLSGGYLTEADVMRDRVVLNENLAWLLFGSTDLAGATVTIGQQEFYVAGVVAQEDDRFTRAVSEGGPMLFLQFENSELTGGSGVTSYEIVLPEPVKGFARDLVDTGFAKLGLVVENTGRFSFASSLQRLRSAGKLGTRTTAVTFPVWENAAVAAENACALLRFAAIVLLIWPAVLLIAGLRRLARAAAASLRRGGVAAKEALLDRRDARRRRVISRKGSHTK